MAIEIGKQTVKLNEDQARYVKDLLVHKELVQDLLGSNSSKEAVHELYNLIGSPSEIEKEVWDLTVECLQIAAYIAKVVHGAEGVDLDTLFEVLEDNFPDLFPDEEPEELEEEPPRKTPAKKSRK